MALVLIVDDDDTFRPMLEDLLERMGHDVLSACDGAQALQRFSRDRPHLVITDLIMPRTEGLETIRELKKRDRDVRVIAMSGGGRVGPAHYLRMAETLGACCTLMKPFSVQELMDAMTIAFDGGIESIPC